MLLTATNQLVRTDALY